MKIIAALSVLFTAVATFAVPPSSTESYQVLYLGDSGVVVLQMQILIDGQGPGERFDAFLDSFMKTLDKNGDGVVTVEEARGKILTRREAAQMQLIAPDSTPFDATPDMNPKDGKISRAELLAYFKRIGVSPFAVKLRSRVPQADLNDGMQATTGDIPLFAKLDVDGNKKLSVDELQNALEVLRKLDRDDDETISIAELQPLANQPRQANRRAANNPPPPTIPFLSLASGDSAQKLIRRLVDKYDSTDAAKSGVPSLSAKNQKLSRMELGLPEAKFNGYDEDGDGQLDFAELRRFVSTPESDLELVLDITAGNVEVKGSPGPEVRIASDGTVNLSYGTSQINVSTSPAAGAVDLESMIRPLFMALDADANGYLEKAKPRKTR